MQLLTFQPSTKCLNQQRLYRCHSRYDDFFFEFFVFCLLLVYFILCVLRFIFVTRVLLLCLEQRPFALVGIP
jgi:hypothetical protein